MEHNSRGLSTKTNYGQSVSTRINSKCFVIFATLIALCLASPASAAPKKWKRIVTRGHMIDLAKCQVMADEKKYERDVNKNDSDGQWCCSKEAGYCIDCPKVSEADAADGETADYCIISNYSIRVTSEGIFSQPDGQVTAPTEGEPKPLIPPIMGTFQTAPVTNAPTADKPKTGPAIIKNRIQ